MSPITAQNILRHELIGLHVAISHARDPTIRGIQGRIVDETRNMLAIVGRGRKVQVPKKTATFRFRLQDGSIVDVDGSRLVARPENRLKIKVKRW